MRIRFSIIRLLATAVLTALYLGPVALVFVSALLGWKAGAVACVAGSLAVATYVECTK